MNENEAARHADRFDFLAGLVRTSCCAITSGPVEGGRRRRPPPPVAPGGGPHQHRRRRRVSQVGQSISHGSYRPVGWLPMEDAACW